MEVRKKKTILFGGTFDPFHNGHLELLQQAYDELSPDRVIVIPTGHPYMKEETGRNISAAEDRIAMVEAGLSDLSFCTEVSRIETDLQTPSYSIDTVHKLKVLDGDEASATDYYFICGSDVLFSIDTWFKAHELLSEIILTVTPRGRDRVEEILERKEKLESEFSAKIHICSFSCEDISSTRLREDKELLEKMVPAGTYEYIISHHLYGL